MKQNLINEVIQGMLPFLNNAQTEKLQEVLQHTLFNYTVSEDENKEAPAEQNLVESFLAAKRIEGCSEKSLKYYDATITSLLTELGKDVKHIVTDDIRTYLTDYQARKKSSKVTIDNIRRILSSFFSWLEDEDYILKSPVRRIHKVKTGTNIKETYALLRSGYMKAAIEKYRSGSAQPQLPIKDLQKISFNIPQTTEKLNDLDRQFKSIEKQIALNNQEIESLKQLCAVLLAELSR